MKISDDHGERRRCSPRLAVPPGCERDGDGGGGDQDQHAGGVRAALGVDVGVGR